MPGEIRIENWYSIDLVETNPTHLFVFGDNLLGIGKGGQAVIRDCANSYGVPTKRKPSMTPDSFFENTDECVEYIDNSLDGLVELYDEGMNLVFPRDGLGTGLSDLHHKAPRVYIHLCTQLELLFGIKTLSNGQLTLKD